MSVDLPNVKIGKMTSHGPLVDMSNKCGEYYINLVYPTKPNDILPTDLSISLYPVGTAQCTNISTSSDSTDASKPHSGASKLGSATVGIATVLAASMLV